MEDNIIKAITEAMQMLGYKIYDGQISVRTHDQIIYFVFYKGNVFGIWDNNRKTFVD